MKEYLPNDPHKVQSILPPAQSSNPPCLVNSPGLLHVLLRSVQFLPLVKDWLDRLLPIFPLVVLAYTDPFPSKALALLLNDIPLPAYAVHMTDSKYPHGYRLALHLENE